jgi:hypothetical protein
MNASKPFCKVCQDAGKPESVYTSHFVRSSAQPGSVVTCPTLLALECRFCHKAGHTVKYCTILEERKKMEKKREKQQAQQIREDSQKNNVNNATNKKIDAYKNVFACLDSEESDDEQQEQQKEQDVVKETKEEIVTYASILSKPKQEPKQEPKKLELLAKPEPLAKPELLAKPEPMNTQAHTTQSYTKPAQGNWSFKMSTKSWADWTDSEDEEDLIPTKPVLRRQPSIKNHEEEVNEFLNIPVPSEAPKLVRHYAQEGTTYTSYGTHTSRLMSDDEDW